MKNLVKIAVLILLFNAEKLWAQEVQDRANASKINIEPSTVETYEMAPKPAAPILYNVPGVMQDRRPMNEVEINSLNYQKRNRTESPKKVEAAKIVPLNPSPEESEMQDREMIYRNDKIAGQTNFVDNNGQVYGRRSYYDSTKSPVGRAKYGGR